MYPPVKINFISNNYCTNVNIIHLFRFLDVHEVVTYATHFERNPMRSSFHEHPKLEIEPVQ